MKINHEDHYTELYNNRFLAVLLKYRHLLVYTGIILLLILIIGLQISYSRNKSTKKEYLKAHEYTYNLQKSDDQDQVNYYITELATLFKKHPKLVARYNHVVVQSLLVKNMFEPALRFYNLSKSHNNAYMKFYSDFSSNSITIASGDYKRALLAAEQLKDQMLQDPLFSNREENIGNILFAYNLIRLAYLNQELNNSEGELNSWNELKEYSIWNSTNNSPNQLYNILNSNFQEGNVSLSNYIEFRERVL